MSDPLDLEAFGFAAPAAPDLPMPNPFLRGPCFATGSHAACAGLKAQWPAPPKPKDPPDRIRWRNVVFRCPCPCGHPEGVAESMTPEAPRA